MGLGLIYREEARKGKRRGGSWWVDGVWQVLGAHRLLEKLMGRLGEGEGGKAGRAALPALGLWNAMFIYGSVDPCFSWEITSSTAAGGWQRVSKAISLPLQLELLGTRRWQRDML